MNLEQQLRRSLGREPPPAGFAERVAARTSVEVAARTQVRSATAGRLWMALAASLIVAVSSGWMYERHRERVEAEHAAEQVEVALRITGETIADVQEKLAALSERRRQRDRERLMSGSSSDGPGRER